MPPSKASVIGQEGQKSSEAMVFQSPTSDAKASVQLGASSSEKNSISEKELV
jgi:hypothetical protein